MKDPDSTAQLPLPSLPPKSGAQVIKLPQRHFDAPGFRNRGPGNQQLENRASNNQKRSCLWYAVYLPQLAELNQAQQQKYLNELAGLMESVSSTVSFHPLALICEIRSSLKYFSGIDVIHNKLKLLINTQLEEWELSNDFQYAASPTVTGSLLLAKAGHNALVYQKNNLRSVLGQLSCEVLELDKEQRRRLYNMGVRYLRDIWRLPSDGLRKRFGSSFVNQLNKALGKAPEPTKNYFPPPVFTTCYELPYELENLDRLLPVADEILAQLCDFLRRRDLSTNRLLLSLLHEKRCCSEIDIGLRQASRSHEHLMLLLETHFSNLTIPAPVIAIRLEVKQFDAFNGHSDSLFTNDRSINDSVGYLETARYNDSNLNQFIEQLRIRVGGDHVKTIHSAAGHCPEHASHYVDLNKLEKSRSTVSEQTTSNPRPFWLLQEPVQLSIRKGKLYHRRPISIVSGPERIETYWWSGTHVRRDYYVATEANGSRLWIYREKSAEKNWYLHGLFA